MRFEGEIVKTPCINMFAYHKSIRESRNRIMLRSDFEIDGCFDVYAMVIGKFNDGFCDGANPLTIKEDGDREVTAEIQLSFDLIRRLENDKETTEKNLAVIKRELE